MKERAQKDVALLYGSHSCSSHCPRLLWMILSRIRFGTIFMNVGAKIMLTGKETSPRQGAGSHLLCPDGWSLGLIDAILRQPQRLFTNFRAKFPVANASIPDLPAKAGVTEIGRKRYRDVTHPPFSLRRLTLLCEELSYFD
jgi:hypothetical protein